MGCSLSWGDSSQVHEMPWLQSLTKASLASFGISLIHASSPNYCQGSVVECSSNGFCAVLHSVSQMEPWSGLKAPSAALMCCPVVVGLLQS